MRRALFLLTAASALALSPAAQASPGDCVAAGTFPVCAGTCAPGETIQVHVVGNVTGTVSCGGVSASCFAFRGTCTASATATSFAPVTCTVTGGTGVAFCEVLINAEG